MKKKLLIAFLIFISVLLIIYTWLGGFQKAKVIRTQFPNYTLVGKEYLGKAKSEQLGEIFNEIQLLNSEGKQKGIPAVIYFSLKSVNNDSVHAFIGLIIRDSTSRTLPKGCKYKFLPSRKGISATLNTNSIFLSTEKIEGAHLSINEFAIKEKLKLQPLALEKYISDNEFVMEIPEK